MTTAEIELKYRNSVLCELLYAAKERAETFEKELNSYKAMARDWERQKLDFAKQLERAKRR